MPCLKDVLSRADTPMLSKFIEKDAYDLVKLLDPALEIPSVLASLLLGLHTEAGLLDNEDFRKDLLDLLRLDEANSLLKKVQSNRSLDQNVYDSLRKVNFRSKEAQKALLEFFEIPLHQTTLTSSPAAVLQCDPTYPLFDHQIDVLARMRSAINGELGRALLHMPTGAGKTRTAMNLVAEYLRESKPRVVLWLAHSEELCDQAVHEFDIAWKALGNRYTNIYRFWGEFDCDLTQVTDGMLVVGLAKLISRTKKDLNNITQLAIRKPFVIIDEAHQAIAPTYSLLLDILAPSNQGRKLLGLSATPGRTWNDIDEDQKLADFFGRQKITLQIPGYENPIQYLIDKQYLAKVTFSRLKCATQISLTPSEIKIVSETLELPESYLIRLGLNAQRNLKIITEIEKLVRRHLRIIVFASSVQQSEILATVLKTRGIRAYSLTNKTKKDVRLEIVKKYKTSDPEPFVLCNYGILTAGFDAPKTSAALIARPTLSLILYSQMVGRATRGVRAGGNETAEIVTVVDLELPGFESVESAFSNWEDIWKKR